MHAEWQNVVIQNHILLAVDLNLAHNDTLKFKLWFNGPYDFSLTEGYIWWDYTMCCFSVRPTFLVFKAVGLCYSEVWIKFLRACNCNQIS